MGLILAFLPFIAFAILSNHLDPNIALAIAAVIAVGLVVRDWTGKHSVKILDVGTAILFTGLALYTALEQETLSLIAVRACVDGGLLLIALVSLAVRRPFTLQYARESVDAVHWQSPVFLRTNTIITAVWAAAFAAMTLAEVAMLLEPTIPQRIGFAVVIAALAGAFWFTKWYPKRVRAAAPAKAAPQ